MKNAAAKTHVGIGLATESLPFETEALRAALQIFLDSEIDNPETGKRHKIGSFKWGVYAFFDYDGEPIYVGQTNEMLRTRIRRHLTNRRTDAVAMNVLDPFEVCHIEVWPLTQYQNIKSDDVEAMKKAKAHLNALEFTIFQSCIEKSKAILNEKDPPEPTKPVLPPPSLRSKIVTVELSRLRDHPDLRIARRAQVMARLAQIISERKVQKGLRKALLTQAERLRWLAEQRFSHSSEPKEAD